MLRGELVARKIKVGWNHAADPHVVGPTGVGMVLVEMNGALSLV